MSSRHHATETGNENSLLSSSYNQTGHVRSSLPTRVRSACDRCRQHKSRCDPFRPCSLCARANVPCQPALASPAREVTSRKRRKLKRVSRDRRYPADTSSETSDEPSRDGARGPHGNVPKIVEAQSPEGHSMNDVRNIAPGIQGIPQSLGCGEAESALGIARRLCELGSHHIDERITSAIPGYHTAAACESRQVMAVTGARVPISSILGQSFPSMRLVYSLVEEYFVSVHWFSLVVYEPTFRKRLSSIEDGSAYPSQRPFLLLLAVMLGMAAWYRSRKGDLDLSDKDKNWGQWSADLLKIAELNLVELMDQPSVTAAQACILLGSHHVYHGRPNLSFSLLGATIKMAQSIGLQRQGLRGDSEDVEERKRVWWTIYTWDRFASITYGRPLSINDKDCNVPMPSDVLENPTFVPSESSQDELICYSTYQRELNRLYLIASPALEAIFGSRTFGTSEQLAGDSYLSLVKQATRKLQEWRRSLPNRLSSALERNFLPDGGMSSRVDALQSLSLQLTYDNILIVLHRPLLTRQVNQLSTINKHLAREVGADSSSYHSTPSAHSGNQSGSYFDAAFSERPVSSSELWKDAAVRTSKITEMPVLLQFAMESHLVAFLAINLFHAAIVLAVLAISEPLSDTAQQVKRTITRILRVQDLIGQRSALSRQSTIVLKNVVALLLRRESEAMLASVIGTGDATSHETYRAEPGSVPISVEDALRLPTDTHLDSGRSPLADQDCPDVNRLYRLNESLASVQHALGPGDGFSFGTLAGGDVPRYYEAVEQSGPARGMLQVQTQGWDASESTQNTVGSNFYGENLEGGLYWLWDMTWNGESF